MSSLLAFDELDVLEHLKATCGTLFKQYGFEGDASEAEATKSFSAPALFVIPAADSASELADSALIEHTVTPEFGVLIVTRSYRVNRKDESHTSLRALRLQVHQALIQTGYTPPGCNRRVSYVGGNVIKYNEELTVRLDRFRTQYQFETHAQF